MRLDLPKPIGPRKTVAPARCISRDGSGGMGIRTPGLLIANETLYQLSYTPIVTRHLLWEPKVGEQVERAEFAVDQV
jgi:hypothetical protein